MSEKNSSTQVVPNQPEPSSITLKDAVGNVVLEQGPKELSRLPAGQIKNEYVAQVEPGKHSLILPLGARATLIFPMEQNHLFSSKQHHLLELTDISGNLVRADRPIN